MSALGQRGKDEKGMHLPTRVEKNGKESGESVKQRKQARVLEKVTAPACGKSRKARTRPLTLVAVSR